MSAFMFYYKDIIGTFASYYRDKTGALVLLLLDSTVTVGIFVSYYSDEPLYLRNTRKTTKVHLCSIVRPLLAYLCPTIGTNPYTCVLLYVQNGCICVRL